jgi:hypothetical protein
MNSLKFYSVQGTELVDHSVFISHFEWIKEFNNALSNTEDFFFFELAWNYNQLHFYVNKLKLKSGVGQCSKRTKVSLEVCCISWEHLENSKTVFIIWFITGKFCKIQLKSNIEKKQQFFYPSVGNDPGHLTRVIFFYFLTFTMIFRWLLFRM